MVEKLTPMMQQYQSVRRSLPADTLLFFRLGDFYEMFFDDAKTASGLLNVALTKRNGIPMCGVPFHARDGYIAKLIRAGKRVAICDQVGEAKPGKIVHRELTEVISPGSVSELQLLDAKNNNYLAAIFSSASTSANSASSPNLAKDERFGFAFTDLSTGEFRLTELANREALDDELARVSPVEMIVSEEQIGALKSVIAHQSKTPNTPNTPYDGYAFSADHALFTLREHFQVQSLDGFGCSEMPLAISAAGAILHYLKNQLRRETSHITRLQVYNASGFLMLDAATQANLELVASRSGIRNTSLLAALDRTATPMGARRLRDWILHPLRDLETLNRRQSLIARFIAEPFLLNEIRAVLKSIRDIERTVSRLSMASGNARDAIALRVSLQQLPALKTHLATFDREHDFPSNLQTANDEENLVNSEVEFANDEAKSRLANHELHHELNGQIHPLGELVELLNHALVEEPPALLKDGGIFQNGYHPLLDELRNATREGKEWIAQLQQREIETTGIRSLKVRFTSVFGYFIEVTKSNLDSVPEHYTRKQTTANAERFITPELKEVEGKILGADERGNALEYELFQQLRMEILKDLLPLQETASAIATLDTLCSLAETARLYGYCRPTLTDDPNNLKLAISDGRHPVLDQNLVEEKFVPNDTQLDGGDNRCIIITGPNMAGKSTYIRQVALLVLMAQIGSYIPAASATIGIADRIFTRVGANDDLARGQSTFMVEMNETANILNNATSQSLVILDEIGRGTSTFDGLSIAWSVAEFLHDKTKARTMFATHYHELTELELTRSGVKNYNVAVREWNDRVIFLRKIIRGGADKSYGIQVARLAGLPPEVVARAKEILANLEQSELNADGNPTIAETPAEYEIARAKKIKRSKKSPPSPGERPQLSLF